MDKDDINALFSQNPINWCRIFRHLDQFSSPLILQTNEISSGTVLQMELIKLFMIVLLE